MKKLRKVNRSEAGIVYIVHALKTNYYKFGETTDLKERIRRMQTECPHRLIPTFCLKVFDRFAVEYDLFKRYEAKNRILDWYELTSEQVHEAIALIRLNEYVAAPPELPELPPIPKLKLVKSERKRTQHENIDSELKLIISKAVDSARVIPVTIKQIQSSDHWTANGKERPSYSFIRAICDELVAEHLLFETSSDCWERPFTTNTNPKFVDK